MLATPIEVRIKDTDLLGLCTSPQVSQFLVDTLRNAGMPIKTAFERDPHGIQAFEFIVGVEVGSLIARTDVLARERVITWYPANDPRGLNG